MEPWWVGLLREQQATRFADIAGAHSSLILPVTDRLVTTMIASRLPPSLPIRQIDVRAGAGNQMTVRVRLTQPSFLPPITVRLQIEQQPVLPASPILVFRILSEGLALLAGAALKFVPLLPPGLRLDGDRLYVNVATLLTAYGAGEALAYLTHLEVTTTEGRIVIGARAAVPQDGSGNAAPAP
jgi:hypothetical protein